MRIDHDMVASAARRRFMKQGSALLASGLAIGLHLPEACAKNGDAHPEQGEFEPNAWVRVLTDDTIKLVVHKHDHAPGSQLRDCFFDGAEAVARFYFGHGVSSRDGLMNYTLFQPLRANPAR